TTADDTAGAGGTPGGSRVAFESDVDGPDRDIFVMNADGSGVTDLTHDDVVNEGGAVWSPDGTQLAFDSDRDGARQIFTMNADGSGVTQLTFGPGVINEGPQWIWQVFPETDGSGNATGVSTLPSSQVANLASATAEAGGHTPSA